MNNDLGSLNNYLFEEIERLNDTEELEQKDNFDKELQRSKAITNIAQQIISISNVQLNAVELINEYNIEKKDIPSLIFKKNR